jgi:hypothetical protein
MPKPIPLKQAVAELTAQVEQLQREQEIPDPILATKGEFFGRVFAEAVGTQGSRAFSDQFLQKLENNAERLWNAYVAIVRGDKIQAVAARIATAQEETQRVREELERAKATLLAQAETIRDLSVTVEEDDLPEEATVEEVEAAPAGEANDQEEAPADSKPEFQPQD